MKIKSLAILSLLLLISACSSVEQKPVAQSGSSFNPDNSWTLTFFSFDNGKQVNKETFQYASRRDCYDAMFKKEVEARKQHRRSGSGLCTKWFVEGQPKTKDDLLGYK